ncbi:MAG: Gfo/Idh/MocA family oxidoreductase [Verrucomicrobia bacterium]|nr:Gfo/Idh/MocA family oxidoreductase [Verrucomicrobiota bacterium]
MVRMGIVGLGFMAATHLKACREVRGARVVAFCNPSGKHLDGDFSSVAGNIPGQEPLRWDMAGVAAHRDFDRLLEDPAIDAIDICAPTHAHHDLALRALRAGKHVLCEKPMARTAAQARELAAEAGRVERILMPAMCLRFLPSWAWLKQAIEGQTYGRIYGVHFRRVAQPPSWGRGSFLNGEKSGGGLLDLHIHDTDFVQFCFGRPLSVFSTGFSKVSGAVDHVMTQYEVASGVAATAEGGWAMSQGFGFNMAYTAVFERATADFDLSRGPDALKLFREEHPPETLRPEGPDGYAGEIQYFIDCVTGKVEPRTVSAGDGVSAIEICEAEEKSIRLRQIVRL